MRQSKGGTHSGLKCTEIPVALLVAADNGAPNVSCVRVNRVISYNDALIRCSCPRYREKHEAGRVRIVVLLRPKPWQSLLLGRKRCKDKSFRLGRSYHSLRMVRSAGDGYIDAYNRKEADNFAHICSELMIPWQVARTEFP